MSTHNIGFRAQIRKNVNTFLVEKLPFLETCYQFSAYISVSQLMSVQIQF